MVKDSASQIHREIKKIICGTSKFKNHFKSPLTLVDPTEELKVDFPKIIMGSSKVYAWQSMSFDGQEHELTLNIWSREGGTEEIINISGQLMELIHNAEFNMDGHVLIDFQFSSSETRYIESSEKYHCKMTFKAITIAD